MTLEEFCQKYNYAESSVLHGFPRVKESILKTYGVEIIKIGRGKKAEYIEKEKSKELQIEELHEFLEKNNLKYKIVYSLKIAMYLIKKGHKVITTMPNPEEPQYTTWIFQMDDTLESDFNSAKGGCRNGK